MEMFRISKMLVVTDELDFHYIKRVPFESRKRTSLKLKRDTHLISIPINIFPLSLSLSQFYLQIIHHEVFKARVLGNM